MGVVSRGPSRAFGRDVGDFRPIDTPGHGHTAVLELRIALELGRVTMPASVTVAPAQTRQLPMLTGIRALAAMLVLGFHINFYFPEFIWEHRSLFWRGDI